MKTRLLIITLLAIIPGFAVAAPPKVAVLAADPALRTAIAQSGAQVLEADALGNADVLVLQSADATSLGKLDRASIEAFATKGGGIVIIGGAIGAGEWLKPLAGGAWTANSRQFSGQMMLYPITDAHPITREAAAFDVNDNTFYDLDLDASVTVLASAFTPKVTSAKKDNRAPEKLDRANVYDIQPQMWTFEGADRHRALVLLQGGAESLQHASIRTFILRGIAWAAKRENIDELCMKADLATLRYPQGGPRTATETVKSFDLHPGFKATAIASEPLINKPIAMQWDARGRLWIAETPEYPNGRRPLLDAAWKETGVLKPDQYDRPATDRISILEDTNGDGVMDKKTVFYEGFELVTGFCLWRDGVIAVHQPDIVFVHGEGAEKKVERLYTGFKPGDTHFVANHFIVAPDGWIYANTGSGADAESVTHPGVKTKISSGIFRFKPDGSAIQQVGSKGGNGFGMDATSDGELFFGQATSGSPVQHVVVPEWVLAKGKVGKVGSAESVIAGRKVVRPDMPARVPYMQIDVVGGYSAATASTVQEGGAWPAEWNDTVFCTEPILDIIHFEKLQYGAANITGEMTEPNREWLRAQDFWFFPVDVEFGPDGAMYVLDFYNPIVAHSDSRGPKHSRSGATVRPDREHYYGRIYRIQHDDAKQLESLDLTKADTVGLVKAFLHPSKEVRFNAHRLLMDREDAASAAPTLTAMAMGEKFVPARILALWALERLGKLEPQTLQTALTSDDVGVRKSALLIAEALGEKNKVDVTALLNDRDVRVRLLALRALGTVPLDKSGAAALLAVLPKLDDDWSRSAAVAASSSNAGPVLEAALAAVGAPSQSALDLAASLAASFAETQDSAALARVVTAAAQASPEAASLVLNVLQQAAASLPAAPVEVPSDALKQLLASPNVAISASALPYAVSWKSAGTPIAACIASLLPLIADAKQPDAVRSAAVIGLIRSRAADARIVPAALDVLRSKPADTLLLDVIAALASTADPALGQPLVAALPNLSPLGQTALFDALTTRTEWANAVLDAMAEKQLPPALLGPAKLSKLRLHPDAAVAKRAIKVFAEVGAGTNAAKDDIIAKLQPEIESKAGNAANGKTLFAAACATCHKLGGVGYEVGPVLDGIGVHGTHELLVHILDPSRVVDNEHRTWNLALKNGQFATGIIARENENTVTVKLPGGAQQDVRVADIKSRQDTGLSLMPEGFEGLGADGLRDILAYLSGGSSKYRAINLGNSFTTDTTGGLYGSREARNDTVQPIRYGVVNVEGVPFSLPDPTTTANGGNVIVLKPGEGNTYAATLPQRVEVPVGFPVGNLHFLSGVAGWGGTADSHKPAMKVTMEFADGKTQVEELYTGDVFIDYPSGDDVPGSKRAEGVVKKHHVRYFWLPVNERAPLKTLALESYQNGVAPTTLAITADSEAPKPRKTFGSLKP
jgi:putative membrane-bound dehydrogenase-like protein